jgi:Uma2 family endonuclease
MAIQTAKPPVISDSGAQRRKLTVDELYALVRAGFIVEQARVELIDGELYQMTPPSSEHAGIVKYLSKMLERHYGEEVIVSTQDPVYISQLDFVEPDIAVLKYREDFYTKAHPTPADVLLLVEVSKSTLTYDKTQKLALYARSNILELWLVNLEAKLVEVYRQPTSTGYSEVATAGVGQALAPLAFPDRALVVLHEALF